MPVPLARFFTNRRLKFCEHLSISIREGIALRENGGAAPTESGACRARGKRRAHDSISSREVP